MSAFKSPFMRLKPGVKAWWICRAVHLVDWTHCTEDGRRSLVVLKNPTPENREHWCTNAMEVDTDDLYDTNTKALEAISEICRYFDTNKKHIESLTDGCNSQNAPNLSAAIGVLPKSKGGHK